MCGSTSLIKRLKILSLPGLFVVLFSTLVGELSLNWKLDLSVFTMFSPLIKGIGMFRISLTKSFPVEQK